MRVAFIVNEFPVLSETFIVNQITGLIDRGHEVDIYANKPSDESTIAATIQKYNLLSRAYYYESMPERYFLRLLKGIRLLLLNCYKYPAVLLRSLNLFRYGQEAASWKLFYATICFLRNQRIYDIIHCQFGPLGLKAMIWQDLGIIQGKLITSFRGYDISRTLKKFGDHLYNRLFDRDNLFLPVCEYFRRRLIHLGCVEKKIILHRTGIDCDKFSSRDSPLGIKDCVRMVTIARLVEKKGLKYGILAMAKLAKVYPNIVYNVVGDGPLREELNRLIQELDVAHVVKLLGWKQQQQVIEILNNSHILIAPSITAKDGDQEGIPQVLEEAMAVGLPVVATRHSGIPELIENGVSGFLVPECDSDALADKLGYLIEYPHLRPELGRAGRAFVEEHHNIDKLNNQLVKIYSRLLKKA